jgi:hypothetical protein
MQRADMKAAPDARRRRAVYISRPVFSRAPTLLTLCIALATATPVRADAPRPSEPQPPAAVPRWVPPVVAVVPGVLVHGSGHFVAGDRPTAWRLLKYQAIGLGALLAGGAALAVTGASRRTIEPAILTAAAGGGLLATSWLADLHGVLAPPGGAGAPLRVLPFVEAQLGTRLVDNPTVPGRFFLGPSLDVRLGGWRLSPGAWLPIDGNDQSRYAAQFAYRVAGPRATPAHLVADGSSFDVVLGVVHHRFSEDAHGAIPGASFDMTTVDLHLEGRYDLRRVAPSLTGAFVEGAAGVGLGAYHYAVAGTTEANSVLVARFAFGLDVGHRVERWGQARIFYDHRHDDFAGGLKMPGLGSGALGYFGVEGAAYVSRDWGLRGEVQVGSAWVVGLGVARRFGSVSL